MPQTNKKFIEEKVIKQVSEKGLENYILFKRPDVCVKDFLMQDCIGNFHRLKELNLEKLVITALREQRDMICETLEVTLADFVTKVSYKDEKYRIKMYVYEYLAEAIKEIKNN